MARFILNLEEPSFSSTLCFVISLFCLLLVWVDKKIKFYKVIGIEHLLKLNNFSSSKSLYLPFFVISFLVAIFKTIYTEMNPDEKSVSIYMNKNIIKNS